jgi:hypothetical protein
LGNQGTNGKITFSILQINCVLVSRLGKSGLEQGSAADSSKQVKEISVYTKETS